MFGYHASHEQFTPSELLYFVKIAEENGFEDVLSSDHFYPWSAKQGQCGFAWSWLGAAMQQTRSSFGIVNAPGQRYNPTIIAQAIATLSEMFPQRFWVALGSGQFLNEAITGQKWPPKDIRNERLKTCADVIRSLLKGGIVTNYEYFTVEKAKLYTRPSNPPLIMAAAISQETAQWAGTWADGLITISRSAEQLQKVIQSFRSTAGKDKPVYLKVQLSFDDTDQKAYEGALKQWNTNVFKSEVLTDLRFPEQFEDISKYVSKQQIYKTILISADTDRFVDWLNEYVEMGFEKIFLHNVNHNQKKFIEVFGKKVFTRLSKKELIA